MADAALLELIAALSQKDIRRAAAFAQRNNLSLEYERSERLLSARRQTSTVHIGGLRTFELYFYYWRVGSLTALSNAEFRFRYDKGWTVELSRELPLSHRTDVSFEGPRMPALFENFLPEGWTENRIVRTYQIDPSDTVALLASTRKYLSNLTLRPLNIPDNEFGLDTHDTLLADVEPDSTRPIVAKEDIAV